MANGSAASGGAGGLASMQDRLVAHRIRLAAGAVGVEAGGRGAGDRQAEPARAGRRADLRRIGAALAVKLDGALLARPAIRIQALVGQPLQRQAIGRGEREMRRHQRDDHCGAHGMAAADRVTAACMTRMSTMAAATWMAAYRQTAANAVKSAAAPPRREPEADRDHPRDLQGRRQGLAAQQGQCVADRGGDAVGEPGKAQHQQERHRRRPAGAEHRRKHQPRGGIDRHHPGGTDVASWRDVTCRKRWRSRAGSRSRRRPASAMNTVSSEVLSICSGRATTRSASRM